MFHLQDKYRISVIIPNYNRAILLEKAVLSVLSQSFPVHEILVCDDGSDDQSRETIQRINNSKVKWLDCGRNGRPAIPRNLGIEASSGDWLAFLDNDDEWLPHKLERQIEIVEKDNFSFVCSNANRIVNDVQKGFYSALVVPQSLNFLNLVMSNSIICSSVLIKKSCVAEAGGFPEAASLKALEDYALWLKVSVNHPAYFLAEPLINYRDESDSSIRKDSLTTQQQLALIYQDFSSWAKKNSGICPPVYEAICKMIMVDKFKPKGFFNKLRSRIG